MIDDEVVSGRTTMMGSGWISTIAGSAEAKIADVVWREVVEEGEEGSKRRVGESYFVILIILKF